MLRASVTLSTSGEDMWVDRSDADHKVMMLEYGRIRIDVRIEVDQMYGCRGLFQQFPT